MQHPFGKAKGTSSEHIKHVLEDGELVREQEFAENRLLILSPFAYGKPSRPPKKSCSLRNHFILSRA